MDFSPISSTTSSEVSDSSDSPPLTPSPEEVEPEAKKKRIRTLADFYAKYGKLDDDPDLAARKKRMAEEIKREEAAKGIDDASRRADGSRRKIMTHEDIVQASYGLQIPYFQKFYIQESERASMPRLASRVHQSLELRKTVGPIYETSTPSNSTTPMFFDFGPCPWMQDVKDTPRLDPVRENRKFIEKTERIKAKQQKEQEIAEKMMYGQQLIADVMMKSTKFQGGLPEYLSSLPQNEQLHILQTIAFNNEQMAKEEKNKAR